jgi:hypothetical protein
MRLRGGLSRLHGFAYDNAGGCQVNESSGGFMQKLLRGLRTCARRPFKQPAFTFLAVLMMAILFFGAVLSQEATQTAPLAYKLQFENEWVRVIRVHYEPHEKIPAHAHTKWPCVYVYLNDGGPVMFRHKDWDHPVLTRPATKAGSFRVSPTSARGEIHEVENPNETPSDFLRVEFKTDPVGRSSLRGRYYRDEVPTRENYRKVQFENEQIRVTRLICAPLKSLDVTVNSPQPALFVILSAGRLRIKSAVKQTMFEPGQTVWMNGRQERIENLGDAPIELLQFDFRTAPVKQKGK